MRALRPAERRELERRVAAAAVSAARGSVVPVFFAVEEAAPDAIALLRASEGDAMLLEEPDGRVVRLALGAAATLCGVGSGRFRALARALDGVFGRAPGFGEDAAARPALLGGFGFAPSVSGPLWAEFPPASFTLPRFGLEISGGRARVVRSLAVEAGTVAAASVAALEEERERILSRADGWSVAARVAAEEAVFRAVSDQSHARYRALVRRALGAIGQGRLEKVVVARSCTLSRPGGFDPVRAFEALRIAHPSCTRFLRRRGGATFLGATPERLLRRIGRELRTSALAGSAPRGRTPEEDARIGRALRESKKEQAEHAVVVRELRSALAGVCEELRVPEAPELLRLDGIQHLHTPIEGRLGGARPMRSLELADRLHPSPAIAGAPRRAALAWIREHEGLDRGGYAGGVGWIHPGGDGELAVALRTVLLHGDDATLHAGAGIVPGSDPDAELEETRLKLRAGLSALLEI